MKTSSKKTKGNGAPNKNAPKQGNQARRFAEKERVKAPTKQNAAVVIRQQQQKKQLQRAAKLSGRSLAFFTSATDPMHDSSINVAGWPDRNIELSVIRKLPQTFDLAFPVGNEHFTTTPSWDCYVILQPWLQKLAMLEYNRAGSVIQFTGNALEASNVGGLQAYATLPGADFVYGSNDTSSGTSPLLGTLELDPAVTIGVGRVVGIGIEVVNTTAELYKSGHLYAWRAPEPVMAPSTWCRYERITPSPLTKATALVDLPAAVIPCTAQVFRYPPKNTSDAMYYTGTVDWHAKDGAYMVGTFTDFENPARMVDYTQPIMLSVNSIEDSTQDVDTMFAQNQTPVWAPQLFEDGSTPPYSFWPGVKLYPINQMGMIITGLTKESTLTMKMVVYYESFPSLAQKDILTLARPSTKYDPMVLELVAAVMRSLPAAVMSKENAEGDWWDRVLKALQIVAPVTLGLFGFEALAPAAYSALQGMRTIRN